MSHSLNEIEAMTKKATRGAGLPWGIAEESGKAVRWLAAHQLPGVALMADLLATQDGMDLGLFAPQSLAMDSPWRADVGALGPLLSGPALNDCADELRNGQPLTMLGVSHPMLMLPFAAWAAQYLAQAVRVSWCNVHAVAKGNELWMSGPQDQWILTDPVDMVCVLAPYELQGTPSIPLYRGLVCPTGWDVLSSFAHRTYAPATEESRALGAGAGVSDND